MSNQLVADIIDRPVEVEMGTWPNGTWPNGTWPNGTWPNGTWPNSMPAAVIEGGNANVTAIEVECGGWGNGGWGNGGWGNGGWGNAMPSAML